MTPPEFSVLLLAWDDADPSVAVLGGTALPPTLPLVYQLAAQQPVLAVYPHLPAAHDKRHDLAAQASPTREAPAPALPGTTQKSDAKAVAVDALSTDASAPGVRLLGGPAPNSPAAAAQSLTATPPLSRIIGLNDLDAASSPLPAASSATAMAALPAPPTARARSQWPTGANAPQLHQRQAPAAPYIGAGPTTTVSPAMPVPNPTTRASESVREAADLAHGATLPAAATLRPNAHPQAGDLRFDPDPELPAALKNNAFTEATEDTGIFEAAALSAPEDDDSPPELMAPGPASTQPGVAPGKLEPGTAEPVPRAPVLSGLNSRMIQYARRSAQLVRDRSDFGVIYAPNWPAWLAALEIRNRTGRPLVLYAASLAADFAGPGERGWLLEIERMTMRRARVILVPTEDLRQRLQAQYGATTGEVRVVAAADEAAVQAVLGQVAIT